jgi:peptidoglycan/LPS O-acetylase OafA/YrhL
VVGAVTRRLRAALCASGALVIAGGAAAFFAAAARFTLVNAGVRIDYPWQGAFGSFAAGLGFLLLAAACSGRWARLLLGVAALGLLGLSVERQLYRVLATDSFVSQRGLLGTTSIAWPDVRHVDADKSRVLVVGADESRIDVDVASFRPQDRALLERTLARRVRERSR